MATATIQVAYEAETSSLKATVNEINQINDKVVEGAQQSASKVKKSFEGIANSFTAAFSGGEAKKAIDNQAKAIDNVTKSGKSLTGQLRGLKQELAALEAAGQEGTDAFNKLLISAAKLEDQIGDTRDRVRILASDTFKFDAAVGATQALASGFEVAQGAAALFGTESEDLQKSLLKVQAAIAIANGVQQVAALVTEQSAVKTAVLTAAQATYATVVGTSTGALKVFRIALAATGVGALVIGLVALYENFDKVKQFAYNAIPGLESFANGVSKVVDSAKKLIGIEDPKKSVDLVAKLVENEKRKVAAQEASITNRINLLKAENKDTAALEIQREQLLLNFTNKKIAAVKQASGAAAAAGIDASKVIFDLQQEALQQESNIQIKRAEINAKAVEAAKKAEEEKLKAREALAKLELDTFNASLDEQSRILNESNNKIAEREKAFRDARFKAGSDEEKAAQEQLNKAIVEIRSKAAADIAAIDKTTNEKLLKERLDAVKAAEGATLQQQLAALEEQKTIELAAAESLGLSKVEIETRYGGLIAKVKTDISAAAVQTQINDLKTLEIEEGSSLDRRVELINIEAEKRRQTAKDTIKDEKQLASELELINAETQQAITDTTNEEFDKRVALAEQYAQAVSSAFKTFNELSKIASENRIADIEATQSKELEAINNSTLLERDKEKARIDANKKASTAIANEKRKQAIADRALAIFDIGINTAVAISKAVAASPLTGGLPFSALAAILGAAQIAAVLAKPIPKFEKGGLIGGKLHSQGGTMIEAEQGEYMVNRRQSSKHRRELDAMNHSTEAFRKMIDEKYVRPALMSYSAGRRGKEGVTVNASLNSKSMEKKLDTINKSLKGRNIVVNINQQDSRYTWQ
jgi:hypothetical protein